MSGYQGSRLIADAAALALPVFPCRRDKRPCIGKREGGQGFKDASADFADIERMFGHRGAELIGVPTGEASGWDVLDLDYRHGAKDFEVANQYRLPETRVHETQSGGRHHVFLHAPGVRNSASSIAPGVDVRGTGGYIIVPPSPGYRVISDAEPVHWPDWLLELVLPKPAPAVPRPVAEPRQPVASKRLDRFIEVALGKVRMAPDGAKHFTLRNQAMLLGGLQHLVGFSDDEAVRWLLNALPNSVQDMQTAEDTARWGIEKGKSRPVELEDRPEYVARQSRGSPSEASRDPPPDESGYLDSLDESSEPNAEDPIGGDEPQLDVEPAPAAEMSAEDAAAEVERLSRLSQTEYQRARKRAAQALLMGVGALDKAISVQRARRRAEAEAEHRSKPPPSAGEVIWPLGVLPCEDGLYFDTGSEAGPVWICEPIEVLGMGRDALGEAWGLWLRWQDIDGRSHDWPMQSRMLMVQPGELEAALVDRGLRLNADPNVRAHLRYALNGVRTGSRVAFADTPGWYAPAGGDSVFALINGDVVGSSTEEVVLKTKPENAEQKMASAGTLDGWKSDVAAQAEGNPVAAFAICMAFAGPLIHPLGETSGGFHFFGRSKAGKTLAMRMGISVWGPPSKAGLLKDWRSTANAIEGAAEESNDGFLTLDEVHQADPKDLVGAVYQLANESGKQRLTREAVTRKRRTWRTIIMSTGEVDIAGMAAKAGPNTMPLPAGAEVRLPSIPIDNHDMWPELHGEGSASALMASLQQTLLHSYGTAIHAFLADLTECLAQKDGTLEQALEAQRAAFYAQLPAGADVQVKEVARRCALIALAGEMAIDWNILPWKAGEATRAAKTVLSWWVHRRGGVGSTEESQHVKVVRSYLSEHLASRFVALNFENDANGSTGRWVERHPDRPVQMRSGWRRPDPITKGADQFLLDKDSWTRLCAQSGADPQEVAKTLLAAGYLEPADGKNLAKKVRVPALGVIRCYVVLPTIFAGARASNSNDAADEAA